MTIRLRKQADIIRHVLYLSLGVSFVSAFHNLPHETTSYQVSESVPDAMCKYDQFKFHTRLSLESIGVYDSPIAHILE